MQITTTVKLYMGEVQEAIMAYLDDKIDLPETTAVGIQFDAENDMFIIEIDTEDDNSGTSEDGNQEGEKKPRRKRRTKAEMEAARAAETEKKEEEPTAEPEQKAEETEAKPEISTSPEDRKDPSETQKATQSAPMSIFQNANSSTPAPIKEEAAPPVMNGNGNDQTKSLFANLTKPAN